jgi:two-component system NtrC family sensor kinase
MVAVEKLASLGKISTMVAHELNNPMSGILSYSVYCERLVEYGEFNEEAVRELRECLRTISLEAERCGKIVQNLLMFAKRSWGEFAEVPLRQIIERAAAVLDHSLKVNDIELERRFDEADDLLWCDPSGLEQLFIALIVNAVEAIERSGRIIVAVDCSHPDELRVRVQDNGRGIPPELLPHIFDPFVTAKDAKSNVGLGLAVAYGIVQSHSGRIEVASRLGEGTTFDIALPRRGRRAGRVEESLTQLVAARSGGGG